MPLLEFKCNQCLKVIDILFPQEQIGKVCDSCGGMLERRYPSPTIKIGFRPYWTQSLDKETGKSVYLETQAQMEKWAVKNDVIFERV